MKAQRRTAWHRAARGGAVVLVVGGLLAAPDLRVPPAGAEAGPIQQAARNGLPIRSVHTPAGDRALPSLSGAAVTSAREALQAGEPTGAAARAQAAVTGPGQLGISATTLGCGSRNPSPEAGTRVNQDCTFRRQAEELIKFNPIQPSNLIAGQNDARVGFNKCGFDYSLDSGGHWGDGQPPFLQKLNSPDLERPTGADPNRHTFAAGPGTEHTYDAFSDPALAFDSSGRAFYSCIGFDINDNASTLLVTASPPGAAGSFYDNVSAHSRKFVVAEDNSPDVFHDKQFVAADFYPSSPNRDNVYVTWTVFKNDATGCASNVPGPFCSPIFGSMSTDHARTWSTPQQISGSSATLCSGRCNQDQGSDPVVLPDGSLSVVFNNGNTAATNPNAQQLAVRCRPAGSSTDGTASLNCGSPKLVGADVVAGEPRCDFGRGPEECIPGAFIRTNDFPRLAVNRDNGHLYAAWQDYRNNRFDIQLASSTDGGVTWTGATAAVDPDGGKDHYFPAIDVSSSPQGGQPAPGNDHVGVSYFRTDRVLHENAPDMVFAPGQPGVQAGSSDYVLAGGRALRTPYSFAVVSPPFAPPDGIQAGFNGDYSGLIVVDEVAHPIWSDTRNAVPAGADGPDQGVGVDEDVFTVGRPLP